MDNDEALNVSKTSAEAEETTTVISSGGTDSATTTEEKEKPKSKKKLVIIIVALLLIVGVGVGVFLVLSNNNEKTEEVAESVVEEEKEEKAGKPEEKEEKVAKTAILPTGRILKKKLCETAAAKYGENNKDYYSEDNHITAIKRTKELPEDKNSRDYDITDSDSEASIYLWYEETDAAKKTGTIYFYSDAETIYADSNLEEAFSYLVKLSDISGLAEIDVSKTESIAGLFSGDKKLKSVNALKKWNTSKITDISSFLMHTNATDISGLADWNVSNVEKMQGLFIDDEQLTDISALKNWDTAQVEDFGDMFSGCTKLADISALSGWKTSKVTTTTGMFWGMPKLKNISALKNWDMSNVYHASGMFRDDSSLEDLSPIANWNVSKLEYARGMFSETNVSDATVLDSWNVSSLKADGKEEMFNDGVKTPKWY